MEPYTPEFYKNVYHTPAYKGDGVTPNLDKSYKTYVQRREFATPDTAQWVAANFDADRAAYPKPYLGMGEAFDENGESVQQYHVSIEGMEFVAGHIAYYFTQRAPGDDVPQEGQARDDRGMWPSDMAPQTVMDMGKQQADAWIKNTLQYAEPTT